MIDLKADVRWMVTIVVVQKQLSSILGMDIQAA